MKYQYTTHIPTHYYKQNTTEYPKLELSTSNSMSRMKSVPSEIYV